jgi:hypothetical protein
MAGNRMHGAGALALATGQPVRLADFEEVKAVEEYVETAKIHQVYAGGDYHIESPVPIHVIHPEKEGTPDFWSYEAVGEVVTVIDYKSGRVPVEVWDCYQLKDYAAGVLQLRPSAKMFRLVIVQPRAYHPLGPVRSISVKRAEIEQHIEFARAKCAEADTAPMCTAGPHCHQFYCRGLTSIPPCPAAVAASASVLSLMEAYAAKETDGETLGLIYRVLSASVALAGRMLPEIEAKLEAAIESGDLTTGFESKPGRMGQRKWVENAPLDSLAEQIGQSLTEDKPVTPAEAERRGVPSEVVKAYTWQPKGKPILKPKNPNLIKEAFQ